MAAKLTITEVNNLTNEEFESVFANVIELCADAAKSVKNLRPFSSVGETCSAFCGYLEEIGYEGKLKILKLHPDLAGRLGAQGQLTKESTNEQRSAGLHEITAHDKKIMDERNQRYKQKFGFPFVICARENKVQSILAGLETRYLNTQEQEISTGIEEVKKICTLRINDIIYE